ncbi:MAG TPA: hypothetical protein P5298_08370 [Spirochaetia bacterium]|nr:hypothetical protein [Spirochaetaceae bacterium]HPE89302.1 hypothetical protein [Spirochaetales bacterium]HRW24411.1 hypothetical protein [Spirochaetia bacterium]
MQAIDRLKSDLDDWVRRSGRAPGNREFDSLRDTFARSVPKVPGETMAALFTTFLSRYGSGGDESSAAAIDWLAGVGSLLLSDYDGTPFTRDDWEEIREIVTVDSGEIDMDTLSYVLGQALEHGAV